MEIEKFKLALALSRPDYEIRIYHSQKTCTPIARIEYCGSDLFTPKELLNGIYYKYYAEGRTEEEALHKVIEQWNRRNTK